MTLWPQRQGLDCDRLNIPTTSMNNSNFEAQISEPKNGLNAITKLCSTRFEIGFPI